MKTRNTLLAALLNCLISSAAWATPAGELVGWGYNLYGQANVLAGNDFVAIAAGYDHSLAIRHVPVSSTLTGDTNGDGRVDLNDLNNVRNNFGLTGAPGIPGDAIPFDGSVDLADVNAVRNNFGASQPPAASAPEPSGWALGATSVSALLLCRGRKSKG